MPPNNSNSTSALSRQMQRLRTQVDRIDLQILKLLQQRTKLSRRIGDTKRRHGAVIYVPERERELLRRVARRTRGKLPARGAIAIYREILSSSRAAQAQPAIGLLRSSAPAVLPAARWCFGACDEFRSLPTWGKLADGLVQGSLVLALLTGADLLRLLQIPSVRKQFLESLTVIGDFSSSTEMEVPLEQRIFSVTLRGEGTPARADRVLILIECKSTVNAVKSWFNFMPERSHHVEQAVLRSGGGARPAFATLVHLSLAKPLRIAKVTGPLQAAGVPFAVLGLYHGIEDYAG